MKTGFAPRVTSYGQPTALIPPEASPHKRRLKCQTDISPRRLKTHLLHQMVYHRTTLRGSEQRSATIARIAIHTRNDIKYKKKIIRVLHHTELPAGDPIQPLLNIFGNEVWIFLCKN